MYPKEWFATIDGSLLALTEFYLSLQEQVY